MHKYINTNESIIMYQWYNHSCTVNIYIKFPKTKQTQGVYCVKFTYVSKLTFKSFPLPMVPPSYNL